VSGSDRDRLIAKLEELRPELAKMMLQFGAHEPDFAPLAGLLMDDFMFMGYSDGIRLYKHRITRRYLNIDQEGFTYRWIEGQHAYVPVSVADALAHVFEDIEKMIRR
jgi:hypothetical protein